jgi:hypothetical protein
MINGRQLPTLAAVMPMLLFACSANASEANQTLPPDVAKAILDWSDCRAPKVAAFISSQEDAGAIVDKAFEECLDFEAETVRLWEQAYGAGSGVEVAALKASWRTGLIDGVNSARNGTALTDPFAAWAQCVAVHLPSRVPSDAEPSRLADETLAACSADFGRVRAELSKQYDEKDAASQAAFLEDIIRKKAVAQIEVKQRGLVSASSKDD